MSDGPSTSAITDPLPAPQPATETLGQNGPQIAGAIPQLSATTKIQDPALKKRDDFLLDLVTALDTLVYMELATVYYLDTSTLLLLLRALLHFSQVTIPHVATHNLPAALMYRKPPLTNPNTPLLLAASVLCFVIHAFTSAPVASELTRFYLHGSLIVDFIGQYAVGGGWARVRLCVLDIIVVLVQGLTCAVAVEKAKGVKRNTESAIVTDYNPLRFGNTSGTTSASAIASTSGTVPDSNPSGIELQQLNSQGRQVHTADEADRRSQQEEIDDAEGNVSEHQRLLSSQPVTSEEESDHDNDGSTDENNTTSQVQALETLYSGQATLMEIHLVDMVRDSFWEQRNRRLRGTV